MKKTLLTLALVVSTAATLNTGCRAFGAVATAAVYTAAAVAIIAATAPPPMRVEVVPEARPGYVWVRGHWTYQHGQYVWRPGYWQVQRVGYVYHPGRWVQLADGRWQWYPGQWVVQ